MLREGDAGMRRRQGMDPPEGHLEALVERVRALGRVAMAALGRAAFSFKEDGTYVTEMDRRVESELRAFLHGRFPGCRVLGEEDGFTGPADSPAVWVVDPIDGTSNYTAGLPLWALSVGLLRDGLPQWGCVYIPLLEQMYVASRGRGAICNGRPATPLQREEMIREDILGITSDGVKRYDYRIPQKIRAMGSAAAQAVFVAGGHYVGYFLDDWHIWDIAAALLIAREAGVLVTGMDGGPFDRFAEVDARKGPPLLFAVRGIHARLLSLIVPRGPRPQERGAGGRKL
jgi:myo-inositol-1(or 4)-monophosphatase